MILKNNKYGVPVSHKLVQVQCKNYTYNCAQSGCPFVEKKCGGYKRMMFVPFKVKTILLPNDIRAIGYDFSSEEMEAQLANKVYTVVAIERGKYDGEYISYAFAADHIHFPVFTKKDNNGVLGTVIFGNFFLLYRPGEQPIWWHEKYVVGVED